MAHGVTFAVMEVTIFETHYVTVKYQSEKRLMTIVWNGNPSTEEYKRPFIEGINFSKKQPIDKLLSDISKQGIVSPESRKWFEKEMLPLAIAAGLKKAAVVTSGNIFKVYYINIILSAVNKFKLPFKLFNNWETALEWLENE